MTNREAVYARAELSRFVAELRKQITSDSFDATRMILACRRILDLWVDAGGSSTDDAVVAFYGIESQTYHVLGGLQANAGRDGDGKRFEPGSKEEAAEIEDCGTWFLASFKGSIDELTAALDTL